MCVYTHHTLTRHNKLSMQHTNLQQRAALVLAHEAMRSLAAGKRTRGAVVTGAQASTAATTTESHTMSQGVDSIQQATSVALDFCYRFFGVPIFSDNRCIVFCGSLASLCGCWMSSKMLRANARRSAPPGRRRGRRPCHSWCSGGADFGDGPATL